MRLLKNEEGFVTVLVTLSLAILIGMLGLVAGMGNMLIQKGKIQNALDAACLAGAQELPDSSQAYHKAVEYAELNGLDSPEYTIDVDNNTVSAISTRTVKLFFMPVFGFYSNGVTVSVVAMGGSAKCKDLI